MTISLLTWATPMEQYQCAVRRQGTPMLAFTWFKTGHAFDWIRTKIARKGTTKHLACVNQCTIIDTLYKPCGNVSDAKVHQLGRLFHATSFLYNLQTTFYREF